MENSKDSNYKNENMQKKIQKKKKKKRNKKPLRITKRFYRIKR